MINKIQKFIIRGNVLTSEVVKEWSGVLLGSIGSVTVGKAESRRLVVVGWGNEGRVSLASRDVLSEVLRSFVVLQEVGVNLFEVSAADEVVHVDVVFTQDDLDVLDISVIMVADQSEALGAFQSEFTLDTGVELVGEGLEGNDEFNTQASGGFSLLEEDDLDEGVDVLAIKVQIDRNQELLEGENGKADAGNLLALSSAGSATQSLIHITRVVIQKSGQVSAVVRVLPVRLTVG